MTTNFGPTTTRTVDLGYDQLLLIERRPGTRVKVLYGGVWMTESGELNDVFAHGGEEVAVRSRRLAVLEGLGATRVELIEPLATGRWTERLKRIGAVARDWVAKARTLPAARPWSPSVPRGTLAALAIVVGVAIPVLIIAGMVATVPLIEPYL